MTKDKYRKSRRRNLKHATITAMATKSEQKTEQMSENSNNGHGDRAEKFDNSTLTSAVELSQRWGVSDATIRTRWWDIVSTIATDETTLRCATSGKFTPLGVKYLSEYRELFVLKGDSGKPKRPGREKAVWVLEKQQQHSPRFESETPVIEVIDAEVVDDAPAQSTVAMELLSQRDLLQLRLRKKLSTIQQIQERVALTNEVTRQAQGARRDTELLLEVVEEIAEEKLRRAEIKQKLIAAELEGVNNVDEMLQMLE